MKISEFEDTKELTPYWRVHFKNEASNQWMTYTMIWIQCAWSIMALVMSIVCKMGCKSQGWSGVTCRGLLIGLSVSIYFAVPTTLGAIALYLETDDKDALQSEFLAFLIISMVNFSLVSHHSSALTYFRFQFP